MTESEKNDDNKLTDRPFMYVCIGVMTLVFITIAYFALNGTLELREGRSAEDFAMMGFGICGCLICLYLSNYIKILPIADTSKRIFTIITFIMLFVYLFLAYDAGKADDVSSLEVAIILGVGIGIIFAYLWFLYGYKDGKYGEILENKTENRIKESHKKRRSEMEVMVSRTEMGLPNPGEAEVIGDMAIRTNVKRTVYGTVLTLALLSFICLIGIACAKNEDDWAGVASISFILCAMLYRLHIHSVINLAVCKGALSYSDGRKYAYIGLIGFSVFAFVVENLVTIATSDECWEIWDYLSGIVLFGLLYILTLFMCVAGNRTNGKLALFDVDGYIRCYSKEENKDDDEE